jgi:AraC-like DNA-binding protein
MVIRGNAEFVQNDKKYIVEPGEIFLVRENTKYFFKPGPAGFLQKRWAIIDGLALDSISVSFGLNEIDIIRPKNPRQIEQYLIAMARLLKLKKPGYEWALCSKTFEFLLELGKNVASNIPAEVAEVISFMQKNLHRNLSNRDLEKLTGYSVRHFNRVFKRYFRLSPVQYHLQQRIAYAMRLLTVSDKPVKEIAATVGFPDQLYFSSVFKRRTGIPPSKYGREFGKE